MLKWFLIKKILNSAHIFLMFIKYLQAECFMEFEHVRFLAELLQFKFEFVDSFKPCFTF